MLTFYKPIIFLAPFSLYMFYYYRLNNMINLKYTNKSEAKNHKRKFFKIYNYTFIPLLVIILLIFLALFKIAINGPLDKASFFVRNIVIFFALKISYKKYPSFKDELDDLKTRKV